MDRVSASAALVGVLFLFALTSYASFGPNARASRYGKPQNKKRRKW